MRSADAILLDLVAAETAGLAHHEECSLCQKPGRGKCPVGIGLAMESIEIGLEAKIWADHRPDAEVVQLRTGSDDRPGLSVVHRTT